MPIRELNFLRERRKTVTAKERMDRRLAMAAGVVFAIIFVAFVGIFGWRLYLSNQLARITEQQASSRNEIVANQDTERVFVVFVRKLDLISQLYKERQDKKDAIDYFTTIFGPEVLIQQINFDPTEQLLVFRVQSASVFRLKDILNTVNSEQTRSRFISVTASSLERTPDGKYALNIAVATSKEAKTAAAPESASPVPTDQPLVPDNATGPSAGGGP